MKILIVGGGFGGVKLAIELAKLQVDEVTLVSDKDYLLFHSTLYSTATGRDERESLIPIKDILRCYPGVAFTQDYIVKINAESKEVQGKKGVYEYDLLVLALGVVDHLTGIDAQKKYSYGVTALDSAKAFQEAFHNMVIGAKNKQVHCAVIGGGMVGVELVGSLTEYVERIKASHGLPGVKTKLSLVEISDRILPRASLTASRRVTNVLRNKGVNIFTNQSVERASRSSLILRGRRAEVDMAVWTSGGRNSPLFKKHSKIFKLSKRGKVLVNQCMMAYPDIYVIGDSAETLASGSAVTAVKDAEFVARNIKRLILKKAPKARGRSRERILSIPVIRFWAYVEYKGVYISGFLGSMVRRLIELNYYCNFLPLPEAYKIWRKYRKSNEFCTLCRKSEIN